MTTSPAVPDAFDHLIWSVRDLHEGIDELERRLGVRAAIGGRHARWGTHNALLALGGHRYLEILADDPDADRHEHPFGLDRDDLPAITHWMARATLPATADAARDRGFDPGEVQQFGREKPDGSTLEWRLATRLDRPGEGLVPTLIDWMGEEDRVHPALAAPTGLELVEFTLEHPRPGEVESACAACGIAVRVSPASVPGLRAVVRNQRGMEIALS